MAVAWIFNCRLEWHLKEEREKQRKNVEIIPGRWNFVSSAVECSWAVNWNGARTSEHTIDSVASACDAHRRCRPTSLPLFYRLMQQMQKMNSQSLSAGVQERWQRTADSRIIAMQTSYALRLCVRDGTSINMRHECVFWAHALSILLAIVIVSCALGDVIQLNTYLNFNSSIFIVNAR